jgi:hypothetical protein
MGENWTSNKWQIYHDNTPAHLIQLVCHSARNNIPQVRLPSYSPDIALCDFLLFLKLNKALEGERLDDVGNECNIMVQLLTI